MFQVRPDDLFRSCIRDIIRVVHHVQVAAEYCPGDRQWWELSVMLTTAVENVGDILYILDHLTGKFCVPDMFPLRLVCAPGTPRGLWLSLKPTEQSKILCQEGARGSL